MFLSLCPTTNDGCGKTFPSDLHNCPHCGLQEAFTEEAQVDGRLYGYDLETYPNCFTARFIHITTGQQWKFEISTRMNQCDEFIAFLYALRDCGAKGVGYNNLTFDYPVLHWMLSNQGCTVDQIYNYAMRVISMSNKNPFAFMVWDRDQLFPQVDLMKIHHFDNKAKMTSLKSLEFCMGMDTIEDLPFKVGTILTPEQMDVLHHYNEHDVIATCMFWARTVEMIALRERMSEKFGKNMINMSDVKMGEQILIIEMKKNGIECYERINGRNEKKQTWRASVDLGEVIFSYVKLEHPEFEKVRSHLASQIITETKGGFKGLHANVDGLSYAFGTGGLHASIESSVVRSTDDEQLVDVDVASFYPNEGIVNKLYPAHLGTQFCDAYFGVYETRGQYNKKTHPMENGAFKLALNGAFGGSNNEHSVFYDPFYTMSITINGQLMLCMLIEQLIKIPNLRMIQANTDGVTFVCPVQHLDHMRAVCKWWESMTCLELEEALYDAMYIRDVNNYMALYQSGDVKRIGCYAYETAEEKPGTRELPYNKDWSMRVVAKAAEAALVHGKDIREFITNHPIDADFHMRAKVPRASTLVMRWPEWDNFEVELANIVRFYVSKDGGQLFKKSPPTGVAGSWKRRAKLTDSYFESVQAELLESVKGQTLRYTPPNNYEWHGGVMMNDKEEWSLIDDSGKATPSDVLGIPHDPRIHTGNKSKHDLRESGVPPVTGWKCTDCSDITNFDRSTIDYEFYIEQTHKIVDKLVTIDNTDQVK